jgi:hypothetical protein
MVRFLPSFLLFFFIFCQNLVAENWHPFPFQVSYYGKKVNLSDPAFLPDKHPAQKGHLIDALYLNHSISGSNGLSRSRDTVAFPNPQYDYNSRSLGRVNLLENGLAISISGIPECWFAPIFGNFNLTSVRPAGNPFGMGSQVVSMQAIIQFGLIDSVAQITGSNFSLLLSKKFGIIRFLNNGDEIVLKGVKDLNLGWQDTQIGPLKLPQVGDQFHFRISKEGAYQCNGPFGSISNQASEYMESRMKVVEAYPHGVTVEIIESQVDGSTGILYQQFFSWEGINNVDSLAPLGCSNRNNLGSFPVHSPNLVFSDSLGNNLKYCSQFIIDGPTMNLFFGCTKAPLSYKTYVWPAMMTTWCTGTPVVMDYFPVYQKTQFCTIGQPLDSVLVTSIQNQVGGKTSITLIPQPAQDYIELKGIAEGEIKLYNSTGKCVFAQNISETRIWVAHLPSGIYFYQISGRNSTSAQGKWMKE